MTTINPHTTRGTGTILTAAIYNADHNNHVTNAQNLNADKLERSGSVTPGNVAVWVDNDFIEDGGTLGTMAFQAAADFVQPDQANTFTATQTFESTDAGATEAPLVKLRRNSASPANSDLLAALQYIGRNSTPADTTFAAILAMIVDVTAASEDGELQFHTMNAGTLAQRMRLRQGLRLGSPTGGDLGEGTINATEFYKNGVVPYWNRVIKAADESTSANTVLQNDDELLFAVAASTNYIYRAVIFYDTPTNADFKFGMTGPASPTLVRHTNRYEAPSAAGFIGVDFQTAMGFSVSVTQAAGTSKMIMLDGIFRNGANAGNLQFQFAQVTSQVSNTTVLAGSYIEYRQL